PAVPPPIRRPPAGGRGRSVVITAPLRFGREAEDEEDRPDRPPPRPEVARQPQGRRNQQEEAGHAEPDPQTQPRPPTEHRTDPDTLIPPGRRRPERLTLLV